MENVVTAPQAPAFEIDLERLCAQILRYLGVVDAFRAEGCEPRWAPEGVPGNSMVATDLLERAEC